MGLDQYLLSKDKTEENYKNEEIYWRKANYINSWFTKKLGEIKNCENYTVSKDLMIQLLDDCNKALREKDTTIFEPMEGFFFGSTDIDEWYWDDIQHTAMDVIELLERWDNEKDYVYTIWY